MIAGGRRPLVFIAGNLLINCTYQKTLEKLVKEC